MINFKRVLVQLRDRHPEFNDLAECCGKNARAPPSPDLLELSRIYIEKALDLPERIARLKHEASPWRHGLLASIIIMSKDSDNEVWGWLCHGAPMGLACDILPGGHFPKSDDQASMSIDTLDKLPGKEVNHASFHENPESSGAAEDPPSWQLLREQVDSGFAMLFESRSAAEAYLGAKAHPAPLGCVSKQKEDGSWKHRLIQDLRANQVNAAVVLPERQVLPRGIDHGRDLAVLADEAVSDEVVETLILDFKDAFMSIPIRTEERRFNCANTEFDLTRNREALYADEPSTGRFVVWRVLGFGGKPNPLVFARAASLASRTAQALLGPWDRDQRSDDHSDLARGRLQVYVDDPVLSCVGTKEQVKKSMDIVLLWWMILGTRSTCVGRIRSDP